MSARDAFEWFVSTQIPGKSPALEAFVGEQRQYLFTLRSEDESRRFVEWATAEVARMAKADGPAREPKSRGAAVGK